MVVLMDGKKISEKILNEVKLEVDKLERKPKLVVVSSGNDQASKVYIRNKKRACEKVGMIFKEIHIEESENTFNDLLNLINELRNDKTVTGFIIQKPIAGITSYEENMLFSIISNDLDVDGFTPITALNIYNNNEGILPCTPKGILTLLDEYKIKLEGKHVVILGRSNIVGKPLALALLNRNATVTICHSKTKDLSKITSNADIIISAVGKEKLITATMIKDNIEAIIDVGMNRDENGRLCGDVDTNEIIRRWDFQEEETNDTNLHYITPVPGGVGPMTVASLIQNTLELYKRNLRGE